MTDDLLEPRKKYLHMLEREHKENVESYFDELAKKANIDEGANRETCKKIYALEAEIKILEKKIKKSRFPWYNIFLFIGVFAFIILGTFGFATGNKTLGILSIVGGILCLVGFIVILVLGSKKAKRLEAIKKPKVEQKDKFLKEAYAQMAPLNSLYEWDTYTKLMNKTTPLIEMDGKPDMNKVEMLQNKFKWGDGKSVNTSTQLVQTGSILGNPFIFYRHKDMEILPFTYTGSLTITWTERIKTKDGYSTVMRSQVLTASVSKPKPFYSSTTELIYGNEAAPDLSFSRKPMVKDYTEKGLNSFYKHREKEIDSYAKKHPNWTPLGNDKFEDFFDGIDRDNEVQYRLLFTPLAQTSMLDIITHKDPYGDDFYFVKQKMINRVVSSHAQRMSYDADVSDFYHFDYQKAKENFINLNCNFFKGVFFDLAPLLAIPLYQQYPTNEYIFQRDRKSNYSSHVLEMEANKHNVSFFRPAEAVTDVILKSEFVRKDDNADIVNIHSYAFKSIHHRDYIAKLGGDGRWHDVPVDWYEYLPVEKNTPFALQNSDINRQEYLQLQNSNDYSQFLNKNIMNNDIICSKGIFSFTGVNPNSYSPLGLNELIKKNLQNHD